MAKKFDSKFDALSIDAIYKQVKAKDNPLNLNPIWQREVVWPEEKQSLFINSIFNNIIPINVIFSNDVDTGECTVVDGKQRVTSIVNFRDNKIPLHHDGKKIYYSVIPEKSENTQKMTKQQQIDFNNVIVPIARYEKLSYSSLTELFARIQNGMKLSDGEIVTSLIPDRDAAEYLKQYCESKENLFKKFTKVKRDRKDHCLVIVNITYMINTNCKKSTTTLQRTNYLKTCATKKDMMERTKKIDKLINFCFVEILNHTTIKKNTLVKLMYATCYSVHKSHGKKLNKMTDVEKTAVIKTVILMQNKLNGTGGVEKQVFKTMDLLVDDFEETRNTFKNENDEDSNEDESNSNSESNNDASSEDEKNTKDNKSKKNKPKNSDSEDEEVITKNTSKSKKSKPKNSDSEDEEVTTKNTSKSKKSKPENSDSEDEEVTTKNTSKSKKSKPKNSDSEDEEVTKKNSNKSKKSKPKNSDSEDDKTKNNGAKSSDDELSKDKSKNSKNKDNDLSDNGLSDGELSEDTKDKSKKTTSDDEKDIKKKPNNSKKSKQ